MKLNRVNVNKEEKLKILIKTEDVLLNGKGRKVALEFLSSQGIIEEEAHLLATIAYRNSKEIIALKKKLGKDRENGGPYWMIAASVFIMLCLVVMFIFVREFFELILIELIVLSVSLLSRAIYI